MAKKCQTTRYDPRYTEAQSIEGAKARYEETDDYTIADLERDLERLIG